MLLGGRKNKKKRERGGRMTVNDKEREEVLYRWTLDRDKAVQSCSN
jgi:hypothetical protein